MMTNTRSIAKVREPALIESTDAAAYWLGFLMADGSVSYATNEVRLKIKRIDKSHISKFTASLVFQRKDAGL